MFYMKNSKNFAPAAGKMGGSLKRGIFTFQNQGSGSLKWVAQLSGAPLYGTSSIDCGVNQSVVCVTMASSPKLSPELLSQVLTGLVYKYRLPQADRLKVIRNAIRVT